MVAASRPRMLRTAARIADTVALGLPPAATEQDLAHTVDLVRQSAGNRADRLELAITVIGAGDRIHPFTAQSGFTTESLRAAGAIAGFWGDPDAMAQHALDLKQGYGIGYLCAAADFADELAPVRAKLGG
jgi:alkanesulfonate monooxygenase SsuD/methylene tetrahydromethanopterin reductase-like flavin-dependent oxidoreductase (luciferase family)